MILLRSLPIVLNLKIYPRLCVVTGMSAFVMNRGRTGYYNSIEWLKWFDMREEDPLVNGFYQRGHKL